MEIAKTIIAQIKIADPMALMAWGAKNFVALPEMSNDKGHFRGGVYFKVNGMKHKGVVRILVHASDTYHVEIGKTRVGQWKSCGYQDDVYCDNLMEVIDQMIER